MEARSSCSEENDREVTGVTTTRGLDQLADDGVEYLKVPLGATITSIMAVNVHQGDNETIPFRKTHSRDRNMQHHRT